MPSPPTLDDGDSTSNPSESAARSGDLKLVSNPIADPDVPSGSRSSEPALEGPDRHAESTPPLTASETASETASKAEPEEAERGKRRGAPVWLFLLVVLGLAIALVWQVRVAGELEQQVAGLEQDLRVARADLGAHRSRLAEIRTGVRGLVSQLDGLRALVEADPGEAVPPAARDTESTRPSIPNRLPSR